MRKHIWLFILIFVPFIGGTIGAIVLFATGGSELYAFLSLAAGLIPGAVYGIVEKIKEHIGLYNDIDKTSATVKQATVVSCAASSYKKNTRNGEDVPVAYRISAECDDGTTYCVYDKQSYALLEKIEIYVDKNGKRARIKKPENGTSGAELYMRMSEVERDLLDRMCEVCDDDGFDAVYAAWEAEADAVSDLSSDRALSARIDIAGKYDALLDRIVAGGLVHITADMINDFLAGFDNSSARGVERQQEKEGAPSDGEPTACPAPISESEERANVQKSELVPNDGIDLSTDETAPRMRKSEIETAPAPVDTPPPEFEPQGRPSQRTATTGYKGIKRKK